MDLQASRGANLHVHCTSHKWERAINRFYGSRSQYLFDNYFPCFVLRWLSKILSFVLADTTKLAISIVGGLIAGLALLVALYFAIKWRNKRSCPGKRQRIDVLVSFHLSMAKSHHTLLSNVAFNFLLFFGLIQLFLFCCRHKYLSSASTSPSKARKF